MERLRKIKAGIGERVLSFKDSQFPISAYSLETFVTLAQQRKAKEILVDTRLEPEVYVPSAGWAQGIFIPERPVTEISTKDTQPGQRVRSYSVHEGKFTSNREYDRLREIATAEVQRSTLQELQPGIPVRIALRQNEQERYQKILEEIQSLDIKPFPTIGK